MAGGPLFPFSAIPKTQNQIFANVHVGSGPNSTHEEGMGAQATVTSDATWNLRYQAPPSLPTGSPYLDLWAISFANSGDAKVHFRWACSGSGTIPSSITLASEGTLTITWSVASPDRYREHKLALDATSIIAGQTIVGNLTFEFSGWTLPLVSTWRAPIIWE